MDYHIETKEGLRLASFLHKQDRDICLDKLREEHPDMVEDYFLTIDDV